MKTFSIIHLCEWIFELHCQYVLYKTTDYSEFYPIKSPLE